MGGPSQPGIDGPCELLEALADARRPRASERASSTAARTWLPSGAGVISTTASRLEVTTGVAPWKTAAADRTTPSTSRAVPSALARPLWRSGGCREMQRCGTPVAGLAEPTGGRRPEDLPAEVNSAADRARTRRSGVELGQGDTRDHPRLKPCARDRSHRVQHDGGMPAGSLERLEGAFDDRRRARHLEHPEWRVVAQHGHDASAAPAGLRRGG